MNLGRMRSRAYTARDLASWYRGIDECERKGYTGMGSTVERAHNCATIGSNMNASYALWRGLIALGMEAHDAWRVAFGED